MKKTVSIIILLFITLYNFAQIKLTIDPYDPKVKQEATRFFNRYSGVVEATVLKTKLDTVNGEWINQIQLKIHRIYKGAFSGEIVTVYMVPTVKLIYEKTGIKEEEMIESHDDGITLDPIKGSTGFFFLSKKHSDHQPRYWHIKKWTAYPNKEKYDLYFKEFGDVIDYKSWYIDNSLYEYSFYLGVGGFETRTELYAYIDEIFGNADSIFSAPQVEFYISPTRQVLPEPSLHDPVADSINKEKMEQWKRIYNKHMHADTVKKNP